MADTTRDKEHLGIDSNVLIAYIAEVHPDHDKVGPIVKKNHAVNPTVIHETYHTCVFKLRAEPKCTISLLLNYMRRALFLDMTYNTTEVGLKIASDYGIGGRDSLILASYLMSGHVSKFVTFDRTLLDMKKVSHGAHHLQIVLPNHV